MIEAFIKNDLTLKRWRRFKGRKMAWYSTLLLLFLIFLTAIAPLLSNNKPLYMNYQGKSFFPILSQHHPREFGITNSLVVDYRMLEKMVQVMSYGRLLNGVPLRAMRQLTHFHHHLQWII